MEATENSTLMYFDRRANERRGQAKVDAFGLELQSSAAGTSSGPRGSWPGTRSGQSDAGGPNSVGPGPISASVPKREQLRQCPIAEQQ
jgi:hypothetical protein